MDSVLHLALLHRSRLFSQCLTSVFGNDNCFELFNLAATDSLATLFIEPFDVLVLDLNLPGDRAIEVIRHAVAETERARVILLGNHRTPMEKVADCMAAGADAFLLEESSLNDLRDAIRSVADGEPFCSQGAIKSLFQQLSRFASESRWRERAETVGLTQRETEVLQQLAEGLSNKQVAKRLCVSTYTVKNHVHNILEKLQVHNRFEAVEYARQQQWLVRM